jgi:hypothetical protein
MMDSLFILTNENVNSEGSIKNNNFDVPILVLMTSDYWLFMFRFTKLEISSIFVFWQLWPIFKWGFTGIFPVHSSSCTDYKFVSNIWQTITFVTNDFFIQFLHFWIWCWLMQVEQLLVVFSSCCNCKYKTRTEAEKTL